MTAQQTFPVPDLPPRCNGADDINPFLTYMAKTGGSDLFLLAHGDIWMSQYGRKVLLSKRRISDTEIIAFMSDPRVYGQQAQARLGSGEPIDTAYEFVDTSSGEKVRYRFRVNAVSCQREGKMSFTVTLRTIPTTPPHVDAMKIPDEILACARSADQGLIMVVGATGNGKSTLLASLLRDQVESDNANRNLVTIESPIEFVYDDIKKPTSFITQLQVGRHIESFARGVHNALRMAPSTILVGETRDYETVHAAVEASMTGHVTFTTLHANSVAETFQRAISLYPEALKAQARYDVVQASKMVVAQRLIPTVDGKRIAIREFLVMTQEIKDRLSEASNIGSVAFDMVERHGRSMMADVQDKFDQGLISEEVYLRQKVNYDLAKQSMERMG